MTIAIARAVAAAIVRGRLGRQVGHRRELSSKA
jgi:hypothetical protein